MSQRPRGLKRSKQAKDEVAEQQPEVEEKGQKKHRVEEPKDEGQSSRTEGEGEGDNQEELRLVVEGEGDQEETDDFEEVKAIFHSAIQHIQEENTDRAKTLLNGAVHELDRMIREDTHPSIKTTEFFRLYGEVLCELGMIDQAPDFLVEAIDRFDSALEIDANEKPTLWETVKTYAQLIYLENHEEEASKEKNQELKAAFNKFLAQAVALDEKRNEELISLSQLIQSLAMTLTSTSNYLLNTLGIEVLDKLDADAQASHPAMVAKALCLMSMGAEKFEEKKTKASREKLKEACELLEKAIALLEKSGVEDKDLLAKYQSSHGEALVHFGNTLSNEEAAKVYENAIAKLRVAKDLSPSAVPDALTQFIHDWEKGGDDEEEEEEEDHDEDDEEENDEGDDAGEDDEENDGEDDDGKE